MSLNGTEVVMGKDTYEFKDAPIEITDDIADYGSSLTITAIACSLTSQYGELVRTMKDSELTRFVYKVTDQPVVESVTSVPSTDAENRTIVEIGTKIRLLYSATEGAAIFYTTDGSEPVFDEAALTPKNSATKKYNGSEGITVPAIGDSSFSRLQR
ncbi:MAG: chitobiase/beta-hexosaminidase C-terminal domain-containing protein [Lachnospiraceae bacterium]